MRNSSWMDWFGAEVGFSLYIHRRGFTSSSTINQCYLLLKACERAALGAPSEFAPTRWATPPCRCPAPPCCGVYLRACQALWRTRAKAIYCSASCRVKAWRKRQRAAAEAQTHAKAEAWERALRNPEFLPFKTPQWDNILPSGRCRTVACRAGERTPWPQFTPPSPTHPAKTAGMSYSGPRLATDANEVTTNSPPGATHGARWRCVGRGLWRFPGPRTPCVWVSPCYANTMLPKNRIGVQTCAGGVDQPDRYAGATPGLKAWRWAAQARWRPSPSAPVRGPSPAPFSRAPWCTFGRRRVVAAVASLSGVVRRTGEVRCRKKGLAIETATLRHRRVEPQPPVGYRNAAADH